MEGVLLALLLLGQEALVLAASGRASGAPEESGEGPRRLGVLTPAQNWQWPAGLTLQFQYALTVQGTSRGDVVAVNTPPSIQVVTVASGCRDAADDGAPVMYNKVRIVASGSTFTSLHENAAIKLVSTSDRYQCYNNDFRVPVGIAARDNGAGGAAKTTLKGDMGYTNSVLSMTRSNPSGADDTLEATSKVVFMWGGVFYLCYTPVGTFDAGTNFKENVVSVSVKVLGVRSPCSSTPDSSVKADGCIEKERWDCFFGYEGDGSVQNCIFSFKDDGARGGWSVTAGDRSKLTWSSPYGADTLDVGTGQYSISQTESTSPKWCAVAAPATTAIFNTDTTGTILKADQYEAATFPPVKSTQKEAFALSACYCPSYDLETGKPCVGMTGNTADSCCEKHEEFIQMVGVVYYWTVRICDMDNYGGVRTGGSPSGCASPYRRVLPQQKFVLRIECPPGGGCEAAGNNLVRFVDPTVDSSLPSWKATNPCRVTGESPAAVWPTVSASESLSGGNRLDYKVWFQQPVKINKSLKKSIDVCYSNSNSPRYYFKVGTVKTADQFAIASKFPAHWDAATSTGKKTVRYAGAQGSFTMYSGISGTNPSPYDGNPFSGKAVAYFMSYDRERLWGSGSSLKTLQSHLGFDKARPADAQAQLDTECQRYRPSTYLINTNPLPLAEAVPGSTTANSQHLTFSGSAQSEFITVNLAGVVAVCYCAIISESGRCEIDSNWIYAGRLTIQGPTGSSLWEFDTHTVFKMEVTGWGLSADDRLRMIPSTSSCTDNSGNPSGVTTFKIGCPSKLGDSCKYALTNHDITLNAFSGPGKDLIGNDQSNTITGVEVFDEYSYLEFTNPIHDLIHAGDVITISYDSVVINNKAKADETPIEKDMLYQFTGEYDFQDTTGVGQTLERYQLGHTVSTVATNGIIEPKKLSIPIGWSVANRPAFTFPASGGLPGGRWTVRSRVEIAEEMKLKGMQATATNADLRVCWGVHTSGTTKYYKQAGQIKFVDPPVMSQAAVYMTTRQTMAIAPAVIFFKTGAARTEYADSTGKTKLLIRFLDVRSDEGKLIPYFAEDHKPTCPGFGGCPGEPGPDMEVLARNAKQYLCGRLFSELWSEDPEGFPVPTGCFFSPRYLDGADPGGGLVNTNSFFREVTLVFDGKNGLKANTKYMIVMNTKNPVALNPSAAAVPVVDLYAMCAGEGCLPAHPSKPYKVFEKATGAINTATVQRLDDMNNPRLATGGFEILSPSDDGTLNLSEMNVIQIKLTAGPGLRGVKPQAIIRMFLWPLTQWNVGRAACTAQCVPFHENSAAVCSGNVGCTPEAVMSAAHHDAYNSIKLTLPSDMDTITEVITHTVKVLSLTLPKGGFFPSRVGVQLSKEDDSDPSYSTSAGMMWKYPEAGRTEGRLVLTGPTGSGSKPFVSDANNSLVVRLQFGATLWNWGDSSLAAMIEVKLPLGYTCNVVGEGEPPADIDVFKVDANSDGYYDNQRGLLAVDTVDGSWERSRERSCFYELFKYNRIYEKQVIYVEVDVTNPGTVFRKDDITNEWSIQLSSKGADTNSAVPGGKSMPYVTFTNDSTISLTEGLGTYFGGNAAVIKELNMPLFQPGITPGSMTRSCCGSSFDQRKTQQYMRVFFKPGVTVGQRGFVIVDAPNGFDFGETCTVGELSKDYYAFAGVQEYRLKPLKPPLLCEGRRYPPLSATTYNRARIRVSGLIDVIDLISYGFQILVTHPTTYSTDQHDQWRLWLEDAQGYPLEGSRTTVKFNPKQADSQTLFYHKSWGMYANPIENILVRVNDMRPFLITDNTDATVTIWPITFAMATQTSLRITAPVGFVWNTDWNYFVFTTNCVELQPCEPFGGAGGVLPEVESTVDNTLIWTQVYFNPNVKYGFQTRIRIPTHNPRTSSNTFYFEFGYQKPSINDRSYAVAIESPRVAALINCRVGFNTNQVGVTDNRMQFELQTMTPIGVNGGIVIKGDQNTKGFAFTPDLTLLPDSDAFPSDVTLTAIREADATSRITIKVQTTPIPPGYYKFEMKVSNPSARITLAGKWLFGTYNDVSQYPTKSYIDNEMEAPGFVISNRMSHAGFYSLTTAQKIATNREDRPGYMNSVVVEFELRNRPEEVKDMTLKAPHGFAFEDDCLGPREDPKLKTSKNTVFGDNTGGIWPAGDLEEWKANAAPLACRGEGREAVITIPVGLEVLRRYAFRILVQNPLASPEWNKWTLNYNSESSDPFQGFNIWTAVGTPTVTPVNYARNQGGSVSPIVNPVTILFRPYKTVPFKPTNEDKGGVVRVEAPAGFVFVQNNRECTVDLRVTGASQAVAKRDLLCEVDASFTKMNLYMMGNTELRGEETGNGNEYMLIVFVYNPDVPQAAAQWQLNTFSKYTREPEFSLDETTIPGFAIRNDLWRFTVANNAQEYNGNKQVADVEIVLSFRDHVKDGDEIIVFAPRGFNIVSNPELNQCENYRPVGVSSDWFPFTGAPECKCQEVTNGPLCRLEWKGIQEGKDPAFAQKQEIRFKIGTRNPAKTPFIIENYWQAEHISGFGGLLASQVAKSWDINPQLADVVITFADGYRSAGSQANLDVIFTPVNDACCLQIQAEFPTEFDFAQATVFTNYDILQQEGPRMVVNLRTPGLIADQKFTLRIYNVRLGRGGGQTTWNLITYADSDLTIKSDERLQFQQGAFRLPGKISLLTTPELTSAWKESAVMYPVKSLFLPRVAEWATAEFRLSFSQPVYSQGKLVVTSQGAGDSKGYTLRTDGFVIIGTGQVDSTPILDSVSGAIQATLKANRPASEVALLANTPYTVSLRVYPHNNGVNTWRFDTVDSSEGFTNTNDGDSAGFSPVLNFLLTVTVERSPPKAVIEVILDIDPKGAVVRELLIIAPAGFTYDDGPNGCGDMCMPGQALGSTGRRTATLASPTGEPLTKLTGLRIRVQTPEQTPIGSGSEGIMWFVEGRGRGAGTTNGWGQGSGFAITQMAGTAVYYAGVANLKATQIAFTFSLDVDAGSSISVVPPAGFLLTCSVEGSMKTISLPGGRPNCIDDPLQLQLQQPLTRGTYSFAITADLPPQTPQVNTFNVILQDQYSKVVDAAYAVAGEEIVSIRVESPTLAWSRADPGQPTMITVGITFSQDTANLQALLIMLPDLFQHDVQIPIDVQNLNSRFPLAAGTEWADTSEPDRIKINLDDAEDTTTIPADTYRWSFPVLMPPAVPRKNLWFISLCSDRSCRQPSDRQVVVSFPMAGFALYEIAPEALKVAASGAERSRLPAPSLVCLLVALLRLSLSLS